MLFVKGRTPYTPQNSTEWSGALSKNSGVVQARSHGETVNLPTADAGLYLESVKTQADIWALPHIDYATRSVFHLLSAGSERDPVSIISRSDFEKCGLKIQFLFVDRPRTADTVRIQTAF